MIHHLSFNPRTYIRYDFTSLLNLRLNRFQSTYLYKVRLIIAVFKSKKHGFNPRTYIRYDRSDIVVCQLFKCFNPRTYIRYDKLLNINI